MNNKFIMSCLEVLAYFGAIIIILALGYKLITDIFDLVFTINLYKEFFQGGLRI